MKRCGGCGSKDLVLTDFYQKAVQWMDYKQIFLKEHIEILQCQQCHELIQSKKDIKALDMAVINTINTMVRAFIEAITSRNIQQKDLSATLGITPSYLSDIKRGARQPSSTIFNFLKTLAYDDKSYNYASPDFNNVAIDLPKTKVS